MCSVDRKTHIRQNPNPNPLIHLSTLDDRMMRVNMTVYMYIRMVSSGFGGH